MPMDAMNRISLPHSVLPLVMILLLAAAAPATAATSVGQEEVKPDMFSAATAPSTVNVHQRNFGLSFAVTHTAKIDVSIPVVNSGTSATVSERNGEDFSTMSGGRTPEIVTGTIIVALFGVICPKTVQNFVALCNHERGFGYQNSTFHRIVRHFVVQGGDFERGDGSGGHSIFNDNGRFEDESYAATHMLGSVAMAAEGASDNGSQFYILIANSARFLDGVHVVFGHVVSGFTDVVRHLASVPIDADGRPRVPVRVAGCAAARHDEDTRVPHGSEGDGAAGRAKTVTRLGRNRPASVPEDPSNRRSEGPRRPHDAPHRPRRLNDLAQRRAKFEEREHQRFEREFGERDGPARRDAHRLSSERAHERMKQWRQRQHTERR